MRNSDKQNRFYTQFYMFFGKIKLGELPVGALAKTAKQFEF